MTHRWFEILWDRHIVAGLSLRSLSLLRSGEHSLSLVEPLCIRGHSLSCRIQQHAASSATPRALCNSASGSGDCRHLAAVPSAGWHQHVRLPPCHKPAARIGTDRRNYVHACLSRHLVAAAQTISWQAWCGSYPMALVGIEITLRGRYRWGTLVNASAIGLALLGSTQVALYILLAIGFYTIWMLAARWSRKELNKVTLLIQFGILTGSALLGFAIAAAQLLPSWS